MFPKDLRALIHTSDEAGEPAEILRAATKTNLRQRGILAEKIKTFFKGNVQGKTIALWGLAFKANTDDMREASSLAIIESLTKAGARVRAYDPAAMDNARGLLKGNTSVDLVTSARATLEGADVLAVVTEWLEFRSPDFKSLAQTLGAKAVFDGRNLYNPATVRAAGLAYFGIGRGGK